MRFDLSALKYLGKDDFRVLTAIEMGMRNHEIVPVDLIQSISKIRTTNIRQIIANLLKHKLIKHTNIIYDGYSLNYLGYDYLAIHSLIKQGILVKIGSKIGVGKESDVYICYVKSVNSEISDEQYNKIKEDILAETAENLSSDSDNEDLDDNYENDENINNKSREEKSYFQNDLPKTIQTNIGDLTIACIKLARLGRTSFRAVKEKRDYVKNQTHYNWLYLSRLSAQNEYKNMVGLFGKGFSVPRPYGYNRHCIIMEYIPSYPLNKIDDIKDKNIVYQKLMNFIYKLAENGLVHGDFNEFNILLTINNSNIVVIDFPQMISIEHKEAENYFKRDVKCVKNFFIKKFNLTFEDNINFFDIKRIGFLDRELKAFGYIKEKKISKRKKIKNEEIKEIEEEEEEEKEKEDKKENNEEVEIEDEILIDDDLGNVLDYEKEMKQNLIKQEEKEKEEFSEDEKDESNNFNKKKKQKLTQEDIKYKVKKMINKQNKNIVKGGKMGNRFKGKKNVNIDLKKI